MSNTGEKSESMPAFRAPYHLSRVVDELEAAYAKAQSGEPVAHLIGMCRDQLRMNLRWMIVEGLVAWGTAIAGSATARSKGDGR